jgi:hypothetical protein
MSQRHKQQTKARRHAEREIDDAELEAVTGGAGFLSGALTTQQIAAPHVDTGMGAEGFIMKDSIIVKTSTR